MKNINYYKLGGSLEYQHPTYVVRAADSQIYASLTNMDLCYVFNSRQMGKSSLRVHIMKELKAQGIKCASVDLTRIGSHINVDTWYAGFVSELLRGFGLSKKVNFRNWWSEQEFLSPQNRLSKFIDDVLLGELTGNMIIFIDEVDSILGVDFKDDFFAFIRSCYNRRSDHPNYKRLTFCLLGVASPHDLIADKNSTAFNIGKAIELTGFNLEEIDNLLVGLQGIIDEPKKILAEILRWTGGQPFLTQKLCDMIASSEPNLLEESPRNYIDKLVDDKIISNWEVQDEPEHLRTIRDRLLYISEQKTIRLLTLYQEILSTGEIIAEDNEEQIQLRLTGLVVKQDGKLRIYNQIYGEIFNQLWLDRVFANIRPYAEYINAWLRSNCEDESCLLQGKLLVDARNWASNKSLGDIDRKFLDASQELVKKEVEKKLATEVEYTQILAKANDVLLQANHQAKNRIKIGSIILGISILTAIVAGNWANTTIKESQVEKIKSLTLSSSNLVNSHRELDGLIMGLKAAIQWRSANIVNPELENNVKFNLQRSLFKIKELNRLEGHFDVVRSANFIDNGQKIITASEDHTIKIWNNQGQELQKITAKDLVIRNLAISPDNQTIVAISSDNTIKAWTMEGKEIFTKKDPHNSDDFMRGICITPDSKTIVVSGSNNTIQLITNQGQLIKTLHGHQSPVWTIDCSHDGKYIVSGDRSGIVKVWTINGEKLTSFSASNQSIFSLHISPNNQQIVVASGDKTFKLWTIAGQELKTFQGHENNPLNIKFSPDGKTIASGSGDKTIKIWNLNGQEIQTLRGHSDGIFSVNFSPDGKKIISGSSDHSVKIWDIYHQAPIVFYEHQNSLWGINFSPDGQTIASSGDDQTIKLWQINGELIKSIPVNSQEDWNRMWNVIFSPDSKYLAASNSDKTVKIWHAHGELLTILKGHQDQVIDLMFSPDNKILATSSYDRTIKLWSINGEEINTLTGDGGKVWTITFSPDGQMIYAGYHDGTIKIWNLQGKNIKSWQAHNNVIWKVRFSPDGKKIASTSRDKTIKLWNDQGELIGTLNGHTAEVTGIIFTDDNQRLISSSADGTIRIWQLSTGQEIKVIEGNSSPFWNIALSPNGQKIASVSDRGLVELWSINQENLPTLIAQGCQWLKDYLQYNSQVKISDRHLCN